MDGLTAIVLSLTYVAMTGLGFFLRGRREGMLRMITRKEKEEESIMRRQGRLRVSALSMLTTGILFLTSPAGAAEWIPGYSESPTIWLKGIEQELNSDEYRTLFTNDPRTPQVSIMGFLNTAARAYETKNPAMADSLIERAVEVLKTGVTKHYYSKADIEPIVSYIEKTVPKSGS
jgi:hypothetical protein